MVKLKIIDEIRYTQSPVVSALTRPNRGIASIKADMKSCDVRILQQRMCLFEPTICRLLLENRQPKRRGNAN